jgi:hypothetical protein
METDLLTGSTRTKKGDEQPKHHQPIVKQPKQIRSKGFKYKTSKIQTNSYNGKVVSKGEKWYKNNDNKEITARSKNKKLGNKEDILPKIKKKIESTTTELVPSTNASKRKQQLGNKQHFELKSWIKGRLGNKAYFRQQINQRTTLTKLQDRYEYNYDQKLILEIAERKAAFKKFYQQIYDIKKFKIFFKETAHKNKVKTLFKRKQTIKEHKSNYYHPLLDNTDDLPLTFAPLPEFKMTKLHKTKNHNNIENDSDMDEDAFVDELLAEVESEKHEMKKVGSSGFQKKAFF